MTKCGRVTEIKPDDPTRVRMDTGPGKFRKVLKIITRHSTSMISNFDTFYAEGVGLSWGKDSKKDRTHLADNLLEIHPPKQVSNKEEPAMHNMQCRDQVNMGNGIISGDERADLRKPKIKIGDEINAYFCVKPERAVQ